MPNNPEQVAYIENIKDLARNNSLLTDLFATIPNMSVEYYQRTAFMYANKKYEDIQAKDGPIPHGFYQIIENSIKEKGLLASLRIYDNEITLISETLHLDVMELKNILKDLRVKPNMTMQDMTTNQEARQKIREILRKFYSIYKENYIKGIVEEKMTLLESTVVSQQTKKVKKAITPEDFYNSIYYNPVTLKRVRSIILDKFCIYPSNGILKEIIFATTKKNYIATMTKILNVKEPQSYYKYLRERHIRRLENNFAPKLNKMCEKFSEAEKIGVLKVILYEKKCYDLDIPRTDEAFMELKMFIQKVHMGLIQDVARLMRKSGSEIDLENGVFVFKHPERITELEKVECEKYRAQMANIKKVHNTLYQLYADQNKILTDFMEKTTTDIPEEGNKVDKNKWLNIEKMQELIEKINVSALKKMPVQAYSALKKFINKDGLLWIYLANNIDSDMVAKIINNFSSIYASTEPSKININNIQDIIKKANLYDYVDDFTIGLIGIDNLSKIINYNQFLGVKVTDEIIRKRVRKVVDVAIRSETANCSSLPFTCDIKGTNYSLIRYLNNDPSIFTSGIDTKTCFCVGVNENDFFIYSLLNKDGYVIKIVNNAGKLVARASCFRKNNVLMINGIRCLNNKVIPENQEDLQEFKSIVELVKLMAKKMITITANDKCPIDYVVCNQAGILENAYFESQFEKINSNLFSEPVNIYNPEWDEFVHMYDGCEEQMLQEVPYCPNHSFTTDFGNHYPALLIESRDNIALLSPRDISLEDEDAIYRRPIRAVSEYISEEVNNEVLTKINRIRALDYYRRQKKNNEALEPFKLINSNENIHKVCLGENWCIIVDNKGLSQAYFTIEHRYVYHEANQYMESLRSTTERDVKLFIH